MIKFFQYNWQVRDEWFDWCNQSTLNEVLKERTGGMGTILNTLLHIIDVEYSWIRAIQGKEDIVFQFEDYNTVEKVKSLSNKMRTEIVEFLLINVEDMKDKEVNVSWDDAKYTVDEIVHHLIIHEIHHIGQLSIWARDIEKIPVPANFIGRSLKSVHYY